MILLFSYYLMQFIFRRSSILLSGKATVGGARSNLDSVQLPPLRKRHRRLIYPGAPAAVAT